MLLGNDPCHRTPTVFPFRRVSNSFGGKKTLRQSTPLCNQQGHILLETRSSHNLNHQLSRASLCFTKNILLRTLLLGRIFCTLAKFRSRYLRPYCSTTRKPPMLINCPNNEATTLIIHWMITIRPSSGSHGQVDREHEQFVAILSVATRSKAWLASHVLSLLRACNPAVQLARSCSIYNSKQPQTALQLKTFDLAVHYNSFLEHCPALYVLVRFQGLWSQHLGTVRPLQLQALPPDKFQNSK